MLNVAPKTRTIEQIREIARRRDEFHDVRGNISPGYYANAHYYGVYGEVLYAERYGLLFDEYWIDRHDYSWDFVIWLNGKRTTIDVKCALGENLIHRYGRPCADICVLLYYHPRLPLFPDAASFIGWTWGPTLAASPPIDLKHERPVYRVFSRDLYSIAQLDRLMESRDKSRDNEEIVLPSGLLVPAR